MRAFMQNPSSLAGRAKGSDGRGVALWPLISDWMSLDNEMHRLRDVGGVVAHALDVLGAEHQMNAESNVAGVFHHVGEQFAEHRRANRVDFLVPAPNGHRFADVAAAVRVEHQLQLLQDEIGHVFDAADELGWWKFSVERHHTLGNVLREIADAFQIIRKSEGANDLT